MTEDEDLGDPDFEGTGEWRVCIEAVDGSGLWQYHVEAKTRESAVQQAYESAVSEGLDRDQLWTAAEVTVLNMTEKITVVLKIENHYPEEEGDPIMTAWSGEIDPPPDNVAVGSEGWDDWAYDEIFPYTGTGQTEGNSAYFVEVTGSSDPEKLPVGTEFEWGT